ncbi:MAG: hypothetical protein H7145_06630 [Akkermansiaceae bacterium]|nr:hypothetical protein [Armatimonadota bacterium]
MHDSDGDRNVDNALRYGEAARPSNEELAHMKLALPVGLRAAGMVRS